MCRAYNIEHREQSTEHGVRKKKKIIRSLFSVPRTQATGFTLIELLISVVLVSVMLGAVWMVYDVGFKVFHDQFTLTGIKGEVGRLMTNISRELRTAASLTAAAEEDLTFTADSDDDGVNESVQYIWSGVPGEELSRVSSETMPVVRYVDSLSFSYYDANNDPLSFPVTASNVKEVALDITVIENDETFHLRSKVKLRNL